MDKNTGPYPWFLAGPFLLGLTVFSVHLYDRQNLLRTLILIVACVILLIWNKQKTLKINRLGWMILLLFAFEVLSLLWSYSVLKNLNYSYLTFISFLAVLVFSQKSYRDNAWFLYIINLLLVFLNLGFALINIVSEGWNPYGIHGFALNKNLLASFLVLSLPIHILALKIYRKRSVRILSYIALILSLQCIIILQSRSAYLALLFFLIAGIFFLIRYKRITPGFSMASFWKRFYLVPLSIVLGSAIYLVSIDDPTREDFMDKINISNYFRRADPDKITETTANNYESIQVRKVLWKQSLHLIREKPLAGVGKGNWSIAIGKHATAHLPDRINDNKAYSHAHNDFLQQFAETGLIGFFLFIFPVIAILLIAFGHAFSSAPNVESVILATGLTAFLVTLVFDFPLQQVEHRFLFYSELLLLYQLLQMDGKTGPGLSGLMSGKGTRRTGPSGLMSGKSKRRSGIAVHIPKWILLLLCLGISGMGILQLRSDFFALRAVQLEAEGSYEAALSDLKNIHERLYDIAPTNFPVSYISGKILMNTGRYDEALPLLEEALHINPYEPRLLNDYGSLLSSEQKYQESLEIFKTAISLAPYYEAPLYNVVATHYIMGNYQDALNDLNELEDSPKKREFLKQILKQIDNRAE